MPPYGFLSFMDEEPLGVACDTNHLRATAHVSFAQIMRANIGSESRLLSKPQAWYIITRSVYLPQLDDIQHFVLMICKACRFNDMHGYAVIYYDPKSARKRKFSESLYFAETILCSQLFYILEFSVTPTHRDRRAFLLCSYGRSRIFFRYCNLLNGILRHTVFRKYRHQA